ncbi:MAG: hypothetical protein AAF702_22825 [Chloroflexota bacterium]
MKNFQPMPKLTIVLGIAVILLTANLFMSNQSLFSTDLLSSPGIALQIPAFAQSAQAAGLQQTDWEFILEEAGITAYTKVDQQLDLQFLPTNFKSIRKQTDDYIMGIVYAPGYANLPEFDEKGEVQVLIHKDGWLVAYLTRWQTGAELFDWVHYDSQRLNGTLLENTLRFLAGELELADTNISFYDFRNPNATDLILVADRADGITTTDSFSVNVPREVQITESTWAAAQFDLEGRDCINCGGIRPGTCNLDGGQLASLKPPYGKWRLYLGVLNEENFPQGKDHTISVGGRGKRAYCGISVIYSESTQ